MAKYAYAGTNGTSRAIKDFRNMPVAIMLPVGSSEKSFLDSTATLYRKFTPALRAVWYRWESSEDGRGPRSTSFMCKSSG